MSLVVTALCGSFCIACLRPLTRRYKPKSITYQLIQLEQVQCI
ncbi:hypothetical protein K6675_004668 [Vibrio parahaemolyticus]|nr:hypothetical protein [Vibrio parahaemolyticus]EIA1333972.1 hypothetical protein [Vibrio parahaemolyticus]EJE8567856.1 hypothetical protein [Vibrio parahaemolyticus]